MVEQALWERQAVGSNPIVPIRIYNFFISVMSNKESVTVVGTFEKILPSKLVDMMREEIEYLMEEDYMQATTGPIETCETNLKTRSTKISWWDKNHWASSIFWHYFNRANIDIWEYDLTDIETIQITKYEPGDHYTWHCDYGADDEDDLTRKLSATLLISDPSEYEGGEFEIIDYSGAALTLPKLKGTIIIFDSRAPHRVAPVTSGTRISLVCWMRGPKIK